MLSPQRKIWKDRKQSSEACWNEFTPLFCILKWVRDRKECHVERLAEWKERELQSDHEHSLMCSQDAAIPSRPLDLWCLRRRRTTAKKARKQQENEEPSLAFGRTPQSPCGNKQWVQTGSRSVSTSEILCRCWCLHGSASKTPLWLSKWKINDWKQGKETQFKLYSWQIYTMFISTYNHLSPLDITLTQICLFVFMSFSPILLIQFGINVHRIVDLT